MPYKGEIKTETKLYLGTAIAGADRCVSPGEFELFVEREIIPRFPKGFSISECSGRWLGVFGHVRERTYVFSVVHMFSETDCAIHAIAEAYKRAFSQECVMRTDSVVSVEFV